MKNILVTGASGYVGSKVVQALSKLNMNIFPVCRPGKENSFNDIINIKKIISSNDIFNEDEDWWAKQCEGVDIIIHVAWYMEQGHKQSHKNIDCLMGSLNLVKGAARSKVKRFVGIGTCFEYDLSLGLLSIDSPLKPSSHYGATKAALYIFLSEWLPERSIEFTWCRLFSLFGDINNDRMLDSYIHKQLQKGQKAELTSGKQTRDFLDVKLAGKFIADIAIGSKLGPVNVCSGVPLTVKEFALQIAKKYNRIDLIEFNVRKENIVDPPYVLGVKNF